MPFSLEFCYLVQFAVQFAVYHAVLQMTRPKEERLMAITAIKRKIRFITVVFISCSVYKMQETRKS